MFGHKKGAFTGADRDKPGLLEVADKGTLFLDELTEMPPALQAKLLRVIQDGVVRRVGSESEDATVDVRFVSATNRDPNEAVRTHVLRDDLFYRLRVVPLHLPPLRERVEDIPLLANHFLGQYWRRHRASDGEAPRLSSSAIDLLTSLSWPGNVRELQNLMEHLAVLADSDSSDPGGRPAGPQRDRRVWRVDARVAIALDVEGVSRGEGIGADAFREGVSRDARRPGGP